MKTTFTNRTLFVLCLWLSLAAFTSCTTMQNISASEDKKGKAKIQMTKSKQNTTVVKIYPDLVKRVMHVKSTEDRQLDFFVFDASGAIVAHHKMAEKDHIRISDLKIGSYIYQVFDGDEMTDSGKMVFK